MDNIEDNFWFHCPIYLVNMEGNGDGEHNGRNRKYIYHFTQTMLFKGG